MKSALIIRDNVQQALPCSKIHEFAHLCFLLWFQGVVFRDSLTLKRSVSHHCRCVAGRSIVARYSYRLAAPSSVRISQEKYTFLPGARILPSRNLNTTWFCKFKAGAITFWWLCLITCLNFNQMDVLSASALQNTRFILYYMCITRPPITVAARSKAWTVLARSDPGIVGSNHIRRMDVCVRLFCVVLFSV
jgi:hypothetical protein